MCANRARRLVPIFDVISPFIYSSNPTAPANEVYIYLSCDDITELVVRIRISLR